MTKKHKYCCEMREHYESLFKTSVKELHFEKCRVSNLLSALDEIIAMTDDDLARLVASGSQNRDSLDKLIHTRELFPNK